MNKDPIYREDTIYECEMLDLEEISHELWQIPSADRPQGEWIDMGGYDYHEFKRFPHWNFYLNCGTRMTDFNTLRIQGVESVEPTVSKMEQVERSER